MSVAEGSGGGGARSDARDALRTGVCYYPEHWPESRWAADATHMRRLGLSVVRVGEFAWSRLESPDGTLHLDWLGRALDTLHAAGLEVVLGTPTATPPVWLVARNPGMLARDEQGRERAFGSRRHYCFSSRPYRAECARIVTALAEAFGEHPGVVAWQTDNEYGCHDTALSYSDAALAAFREWCRARYGTIEALNAAWGNVFWSMEYDGFERVGLPVGAVTETNPAHRMAFWRFASDEIASFNREQVEIIRARSPGRDIVHNFMGNFVEFEHRSVARDLDVATWDSYPLGFLLRDGAREKDAARYLRTGHPDNTAFHHDLYRGLCRGRWWVMEQQPGPVNWAPWNPAPLPGMLRLWCWEAFAHGAEIVSIFRWRQARAGQEMMHTALLLPNGDEDAGAAEMRQLAAEIAQLGRHDLATRATEVAIVFDYAGDRMQRLNQPGARTFDPLHFAQRVHGECRRLGLDVDIVDPEADLSAYRLVLLVNATESREDLVRRLAATEALVVLFPRSGSRDAEMGFPEGLPPGVFRGLIDLKVVRAESLPPFERPEAVASEATRRASGRMRPRPFIARDWRERVESSIEPRARFADGWGLHYASGRVHYINAIPSRSSLGRLLAELLEEAGVATRPLPSGVRLRSRGALRFAFNLGPDTHSLAALLADPPSASRDTVDTVFRFPPGTPLLIGEDTLAPASLAVWLADGGAR